MSATEKPAATAEEVEAAWNDNKLAQVLYHDWEASTYDEKWSISYDERCVDYARDRFTAVAGSRGWPYGKSLEIERQQFAALFATEDRGIGMKSFVENGPGKAEFKGN